MPKFNIARQMILALLLPTLFIGGGLLILITTNNQQVMSEYNREKMSNKLEMYATEVTQLLTQIEQEGKLLSTYANLQVIPDWTSSPEAIQQERIIRFSSYVKALSHNHPGIVYSVYFLPQGNLYANSFSYTHTANQTEPTRLSLPSESYFTQNLLDENKQWFFNVFKTNADPWVGPYKKETGQGSETMLSYTLPIYSEDNIIAVIAIDYPLANLQSTLSAMNYYKTGYVALLDKNLKFISHPTLKTSQTITEQLGDSYLFMETLFDTSESGQLSYRWFDDKQKVLVFKKLPNQWLIALTAYEDEVFFQSQQMNQQLIFVFTVALFSVCLFSILIGRGISRPLTRLTTALASPPAQRSATIEELRQSSDEIGTLAQRLSDYLRLIDVEAKQLADYNDNLDQMAVQRNMDLSKANTELLQKREAIQHRQEMLKLQNEHLERSIQEMVAAERQLVDQKKMASYRELLTRVSTEIKQPMKTATDTLKILQTDLAALKTQIKIAPDTNQLLPLYRVYQKNNRRLFSSLILAKDIVDYIKDLATDSKLKTPDTIELIDYLNKAKAACQQMTSDSPMLVTFPENSQVFLQLDATKFLHLLSSLLIHMGTRENPRKETTALRIEFEVLGSDLKLRLIDLSYTMPTADPSVAPPQSPSSRLDLSMVSLLMKDGFGGSLDVEAPESLTELAYILYFPRVIADENA